MRIVQLRSYALTAPLDEPFYFSQHGVVTQRGSLIVEVVTDAGVSGFGEAMCNGLQPPELAQSFLHHVIEDIALGRELSDVAVIHDEISNRLRDFGRQGASMAALSGFDIAVWDALGQQAGVPVYKLLGGAFRRAVVPYATGFYRTDARTTDDLVAEARAHVAAGFRAMKVKVGLGIDADLEVLTRIREAVGADVRIMADANHAYDAGTARRLVIGCAALGVHWLEEPIIPEDLAGMRELRGLGTSVLIAAGEGESGLASFLPWMRERAVDVLQPDLAFVGGFTTMRQIGWVASAAGQLVNPHVWGTAIGLAASLQAIAALPQVPPSRGSTEPMLEYDSSSHPFRRELVQERFDLAGGMVHIPDRPGIGVTVERDLLLQYAK
jgi:D-galactarolactone cycloisomerase